MNKQEQKQQQQPKALTDFITKHVSSFKWRDKGRLWIHRHQKEGGTSAIPLFYNQADKTLINNLSSLIPLYVVVYFDETKTGVEWGWIHPIDILKTEIFGEHTHWYCEQRMCKPTLPLVFRPAMYLTKILPIIPPTKEISMEEIYMHFEKRFRFYSLLKLRNSPCTEDMQLTNPQELAMDQRGFFVMRTLVLYCVPLINLNPFLREMINYEVALFKYRIHTCWLAHLLNIWTSFLKLDNIPFRSPPTTKDHHIAEIIAQHPKRVWYQLRFEHILDIVIKAFNNNKGRAEIYLWNGFIYLHEGHIRRIIPRIYRKYLEENFFDQVIEENETIGIHHMEGLFRPDNSQFRKRIRMAYPQIMDLIGDVSPVPILHATIKGGRSGPLTIKQLANTGPRCIKGYIQIINQNKWIGDDKRVRLYSAFITSGVSIPEFTHWMKAWSRKVYHSQGPQKVSDQLREVDTKIVWRSRKSADQAYGCEDMLREGLCGCAQPLSTDNIEDFYQSTPRSFCSRLLRQQRAAQMGKPVAYREVYKPKDYMTIQFEEDGILPQQTNNNNNNQPMIQ